MVRTGGYSLIAVITLISVLATSQTDAAGAPESISFVAPPRTISDITAILDEQKQADPQAAEKARAVAAQNPPSGARGVDLARFYWKRGLAACRIGDIKRQLADLREAERL